MQLPPDHPQRIELNDEVHARPPEALVAPVRISYLAVLPEPGMRDRELDHVRALARRFDVAGPPAGATHFSADLGAFRLKWERHTEFRGYSFIVPGIQADPFAPSAMAAVPADWLEGLGGQLSAAVHAALVRGTGPVDHEVLSAAFFRGNVLVGGSIAAGEGIALTDFHIGEDRFSRLHVIDRGMTPRQAGRMVQRLIEIDTYRIMALLALHVARQQGPLLNSSERELARITTALAKAEKDESVLLERLTHLEAEIGSRESEHTYRFAASAAYYRLVQTRIAELREERIEGLQTFQEFTERRLAPAMNTCQAVAARQRELSERVARATQLLSTRVDVTREIQNQALLESMNRRAKLQFRLQQTVEGLSVAAITYYAVGLIGYLARGAKSLGYGLDVDLAMAISIPLVAALAALGVRKIRRSVTRRAD